jgi:hypothetical protein
VEVSITLEREDLEAFQKCLLNENKGLRARIMPLLVLLYAFLIAGFVLIALLNLQHGGGWFALAMIGGAVCGGGVVWSVKRIVIFGQKVVFNEVLARFKRGPWKVSITPAELTIEAPTFRECCRWLHFRAVIQTGNHIFLLTGLTQGYIIPRACFATDQDFLDFGRRCREYFDAIDALPAPEAGPVTTLPSVARRPGSTEITNAPPKR